MGKLLQFTTQHGNEIWLDAGAVVMIGPGEPTANGSRVVYLTVGSRDYVVNQTQDGQVLQRILQARGQTE